MPRLVLFDDKGGEMFSRIIPQEHVEAFARIVGPHVRTIQTFASIKRELEQAVNVFNDFVLPPPRTPRRRRRK